MGRWFACRSLLAPLACAIGCGGDPPAFPSADPTTSGATFQVTDDAPTGSSATSEGTGESESLTGPTDPSTGAGTGPTDDGTSTGSPPDPIVCRDPDGLCHAPLAFVLVGVSPGAIAAGDLDGDGALDLVVADSQQQALLAVLIGAGDGTFAPPQWIPLAPANGISSIVIAPLDGDAALDIAVGLAGDNEVIVLRGDGRGGLEQSGSIVVGQAPEWLVTGDFDVDGVLDLAVALGSGFGISVAHGVPGSEGGFDPPMEQPLLYRPTRLVPTQAFGGLLGLVVASRTDNRIELLAGTAMGSFLSLASLGVEMGPVYADVADLDADDLLDIVSVHRGNNRIIVRRGIADLQFGPGEQYEAIGGPNDAVLADMNVDGLPDMVVCGNGDEAVAIVQGQPGGTFGPPVVYASGLDHERLVVADLNDDGAPDVASTGQSPGAVYIVLSHAS